ncbi:hypothetical protein [Alienimonas californiensis]|uniref:Uncharacterized protein n=1 Tax=Alienimonas californiensis TaxID=2527989 RepID=A0A517P960_9PLAN|nr:hypothetical protein [Alienimonas californiensis]QDT15907.1 hypothetical protein CA12_20050 [Alienimonas californiensis]
MSPDVLTLEPTDQTAPVGTFEAEPLGDGPEAGVKLKGSDSWCGLGCGLVGILFATGVLTAIASQFFPEFGWPDWTLGLILVPGGAAFLALLGYGLMVRWAVHPGEAAISPWPLRPGDVGEVRFAQRLKKGLALRELRAELKCVESARYRVGTNTRTETADRYALALPPIDLSPEGGAFEPARQAVTAVWEIALPADAPPSLDTSNNDVNWTLTVTLVIDRHPDAHSTFKLHVV